MFSDDSAEVALVICEGAPLMPTYWAYLAAPDLDAARAMLAAREKIEADRPEWIGSIPAASGAVIDERIAAWLHGRRIDAAVWTAVPVKFDGCEGRLAAVNEIVARLDAMDGEERAEAEEYVRRTPAHIDTRYRREIATRLGWTPHRDAHVTRIR